jgi:hypothetical protein
MASQTGTHIIRRPRVPLVILNHVLDISLQTYGAQVDQLRADFAETVGVAQVEQELRSKKYKIVTITHVDTSTGANVPSVSHVRAPPNSIIPFHCQVCFRTLSRWLMP